VQVVQPQLVAVPAQKLGFEHMPPVQRFCVQLSPSSHEGEVQHTPSTQRRPDSHCASRAQPSPGGRFGAHTPALQCAPSTHSESLTHRVGQAGGSWATAPVQNTGRKRPQSRASVAAVHARSSATPEVTRHAKSSQLTSPREPWHVDELSQTGEPAGGQSATVAQQVPSPQQ
jgi:hypothetical protein